MKQTTCYRRIRRSCKKQETCDQLLRVKDGKFSVLVALITQTFPMYHLPSSIVNLMRYIVQTSTNLIYYLSSIVFIQNMLCTYVFVIMLHEFIYYYKIKFNRPMMITYHHFEVMQCRQYFIRR